MSYKRPKQVTDKEINSFKEIEINKITSSIQNQNRGQIFKYKYQYISLILVIAITLTVFGLTRNNELPYIPNTPYIQDEFFTVEKLDNQTFQMLTTTENTYMEFYYNGYIVYENDFNILGDYQYNQRYTEVPDEIKSQININFDAFSIGEYKYFLEIDVEGDVRYYYIEVYGTRSYSTYITGFDETLDFEDSIRDIFSLIEEYPPVFVEENYGGPVYRINENISEIEDQARIERYTNFVERYYKADDYFTFEASEYTTIITYDNVVILTQDNQVESNHSYTSSTTTQSSYLKENDVAFLTKQTKFYPLGQEYVSSSAMPLSQIDENLAGYLTEFIHNQEKHAYLVIYKDQSIALNNVDYVEVTYKIKSQFQTDPQTQTITLDTIHYNDALLVEAYAYTEYLESYSTSVFSNYEITFYDAIGNLIYHLTIK